MPKFLQRASSDPSAGSRKHTAPPSTVLKTLVAWKESIEASPKEAAEAPFFLTPNACAAS